MKVLTRIPSASLVALGVALAAGAQAQVVPATTAPSGDPDRPAASSSVPPPGQTTGEQQDSGTAPVAASVGQSGGGLDDIVVTARKTTENNQKAPASIVAVGGGELQTRGISDAQALAKILPSANLRSQGPVTQVFIRGIGTRTDLPNFAAASAFLYNGVIVQRYGTFGLTYDLDRVESIAGPQGTLYGGSAAGGAVNLYAAAPKRDRSGYLQVQYGDYDALNVTGAQDVAIGEDVSVRAAGIFARRDSYYNNGMNSQNYWSGRLSAAVHPTSDFSATIFYTHGHDTGRPVTNLQTNPPRDPDHPFTLPVTGTAGNRLNGDQTRQDNRNDLLSADLNWELGGTTFTYIPAYVNFTAAYVYYTGTAGNQLQVYDHERQMSHELRWNAGLGPVRLTLGAFYLRNRTSFNDALYRFTSPTTFVATRLNVTEQTNESYAFFAQGIVSLSDRLRVTLGGRYSHDRIDASGAGAAGVPINVHRGQGRGDYKVGVDWDLAPRVLVYANLQSGYIAFGYNPDVAGNPLVPQSKLTAVSGGVKSRFLDNRFELNVEGYHYSYDNFQAIQFVSAIGLSTVLNAKNSTIYGVDVSLRAQVSPTISANAALVVQRARYDQFQGTGYNYSGNRLINAPEVNFQGGVDKRFDLRGGASIIARANTQVEGSYFGGFENFPTQRQRSFHRTDLSLTFAPASERWSIQAFVRNVEDATVFTTINGGSLTTLAGGGLEPPRTFGGRLSVKWP